MLLPSSVQDRNKILNGDQRSVVKKDPDDWSSSKTVYCGSAEDLIIVVVITTTIIMYSYRAPFF